MDLSDVRWIKSSLSGDNGGECIEVADLKDVAGGPDHKVGHTDLIAVRDSKDPDGPKLFFTPAEWDAFLSSVKADTFDPR
ncbi:DUF397 domain-containing protein [Streptosporangium sp. NPDC051022]|uniref:DUF397 domain-containing protein n=1 Tax=Streptosporangium sp. NPDC051022 TaxID=3155752 RepID=UPI00342389BD